MSAAAVRRLRAALSTTNRGLRVDARKVRVLDTPSEFYGALVDGIERAERRVTLASLYLGTGEKEQRLVQALHSRMAAQPALEATVVLDHNRGLRRGRGGEPTSADMLAPLVRDHRAASAVGFYLMPQLRGAVRWIPSKYRRGLAEGAAVQHLKAYVFDDTVIMSGANLSDDYFTNRQDRYIVFDDAPALADHYHSLVESLIPFSHELARAPGKSDPGVEAPRSRDAAAEAAALASCLARSGGGGDDGGGGAGDEHAAWVYPTIQSPALALRNDEAVTRTLLRLSSSAEPDAGAARIDISSGYLNLHDGYSNLLVGGETPVRILTASPQANGFYGAKGVFLFTVTF